MFIELTDHLRCPEEHEEQFLVLLPDRMRGREVEAGALGCPLCGRTFSIADGVADFGGGQAAEGSTAFSPKGALALLGVEGAGGYVGLIGTACGLAAGLEAALPGVHFAAINPALQWVGLTNTSALRARRLPLKSSSMRGVIIGLDYGANNDWIESAVKSVLPGLRTVVEGPPPAHEIGAEVLAQTPECWVGTRPKGK